MFHHISTDEPHSKNIMFTTVIILGHLCTCIVKIDLKKKKFLVTGISYGTAGIMTNCLHLANVANIAEKLSNVL